MKRFRWSDLNLLKAIRMKFTLIDFDDNQWQLSTEEIHTIIQDSYTIFVIFKSEGSYKTFPNSASNRASLPPIRFAQEAKHN
ncbi:hypothetical protein [Variovorax durovernensis]